VALCWRGGVLLASGMLSAAWIHGIALTKGCMFRQKSKLGPFRGAYAGPVDQHTRPRGMQIHVAGLCMDATVMHFSHQGFRLLGIRARQSGWTVCRQLHFGPIPAPVQMGIWRASGIMVRGILLVPAEPRAPMCLRCHYLSSGGICGVCASVSVHE
jgi:hypothetical protein